MKCCVFVCLFVVISNAAFVPYLKTPIPLPLSIRPGASIPLLLRFGNSGTTPATPSYGTLRVFVHLETTPTCGTAIIGSSDHEPTIPFAWWFPGTEVFDGPFFLTVPTTAAKATHYVHVGIYNSTRRFVDKYIGTIQVDPTAPIDIKPIVVHSDSQDETTSETQKLDLINLTSSHVSVIIDKTSGSFGFYDIDTQVSWLNDPFQRWFGEAWIQTGVSSIHFPLISPLNVTVSPNKQSVTLGFASDPTNHVVAVSVTINLLSDGRSVEFTCTSSSSFTINKIRLLSRSLGLTELDSGGRIYVPIREGIEIPAEGTALFSKSLQTSSYEGCHMQMLGFKKHNTVALLSWDSVYVEPIIQRTTTYGLLENENSGAERVMFTSLYLTNSANSFKFACLGNGDVITIAKAYRIEAQRRGLVQTWDQKIIRNNAAEKLIGATNVKLWAALSRSQNASGYEISHYVSWTFNESALIAEHIKNDLKIENVLFTIGGWIHRGYDNQHPDILPTAPECGGDVDFISAMKRISNTGFIPCLHDNYQDIYIDSPSWNESFIMISSTGSLVKGGIWAGGQAYLTCSQEAAKLAKRSQNLPAVRTMMGPGAYFIDTTYAAGLQTCYSHIHPLKLADDMKYKLDLSDYARNTFGLFGSEDGREWAIPHADFFEGITGVSGGMFHDDTLLSLLNATPLPLFEMVYHDCIAAYGKYGYSPQTAAEYVLRHLLMGRTLNFHSIPHHIYYKGIFEFGLTPSAIIQSNGKYFLNITYKWFSTTNSYNTSGLNIFVHLLDLNDNVIAQDDHSPSFSQWPIGTFSEQPRTIILPTTVTSPIKLCIGVYNKVDLARIALNGYDIGNNRYLLGTLTFSNNSGNNIWIVTQPPTINRTASECFVRGDGGWTENLHQMDKFLKNMHEVLSPLNILSAKRLLDSYKQLSIGVYESKFGDDIQVIVNFGPENTEIQLKDGSKSLLPIYGFIIDSPTYQAFYALKHHGVEYTNGGAMFTITSKDKKPIYCSSTVRVFHAFGSPTLIVCGKNVQVFHENVFNCSDFSDCSTILSSDNSEKQQINESNSLKLFSIYLSIIMLLIQKIF